MLAVGSISLYHIYFLENKSKWENMGSLIFIRTYKRNTRTQTHGIKIENDKAHKMLAFLIFIWNLKMLEPEGIDTEQSEFLSNRLRDKNRKFSLLSHVHSKSVFGREAWIKLVRFGAIILATSFQILSRWHACQLMMKWITAFKITEAKIWSIPSFFGILQIAIKIIRYATNMKRARKKW